MKKAFLTIAIAATFAALSCEKAENPYEPKVYTGTIFEGEPVEGGNYNVVRFGGGCNSAWCTMNVGATKPEEVGGLYRWGDINNYKDSKAGAKMKEDTATKLLGEKY